jgi:hypothetical protein
MGGSMKKLDHGCVRKPDVPERNMRKFFKHSTVTVGLLATLGLGGMATGIIAPKTAAAEQAKTKRIADRDVQVLRTQTSFQTVDRNTEPYRIPEQKKKLKSSGEMSGEVTMNGVKVESQAFRLVVSRTDLKIDYSGDTSRVWEATVFFPKEREQNPSRKDAGTRKISLGNFAEYISKATGEKMESARILMETGTFQYNGESTWYADVYVLPLNGEGEVIGKQSDGGNLAYTISYYANLANGATALITEPTDTRVARR